MTIERVKIRNFKHIDYLDINIKQVNCFIGINNIGKTSILQALQYFYNNLTRNYDIEDVFNIKNPYIQELEITVTYNLEYLMEEARFDFDNLVKQKINTYLKKYCDNNNKLSITLKKFKKNNGVVWNVQYEGREVLKKCFPIFYLETRKIDLHDWSSIWNIFNFVNPFSKRVESLTSIKDNEVETLNKVKTIFKENGISIKNTSFYEKISTLIQLEMGGNKFSYGEFSLSLSSYGFNSLSYLIVYVSLIVELFEDKNLATPIIIVDEPELHLHSKNVEVLLDKINLKSIQNVKFIFTTHSSSFLKSIVITRSDTQVLHVTKTEHDKLVVKKMKDLRNNKKIRFMSDREANLFFSTGCLFVEGDTELELFTNENIVKIFPKLKDYDIYNYDSKIDKLKLVNPRDKKIYIKYLLLLDIDKIIDYNPDNKRIKSLKKEKYLNLLENKRIIERENFYYNDKYIRTLPVRKKINSIINQTKFNLDEYKLEINSDLFYELKLLIKQYFKEYNLYPMDSTIEGAIINKENCSIVYTWLLGKVDNKNLLHQVCSDLTDTQKSIVIRMLFEGKSDSLKNDKKLKTPNYRGDIANLRTNLLKKDKLNNNKSYFNKRSGWVTDFLDWYFDNYIDFTKSIEHNKSIFASHFKELNSILSDL